MKDITDMNPVITNYESLSSITGQMRSAAANGEWERLVELEKQCSRRVESIMVLDSSTPLDESSRKRKLELIRKILSDDEAIRNCTQPWMAQLQKLIQGTVQQRNVLNAYVGKR